MRVSQESVLKKERGGGEGDGGGQLSQRTGRGLGLDLASDTGRACWEEGIPVLSSTSPSSYFLKGHFA